MTPYATGRETAYIEPGTGAAIWSRRADETLLYEFDVTDPIEANAAGDSASEIENKESSGITIDTLALDGNVIQITISKGSGFLIAKVTTAGGYIFEFPFKWNLAESVGGKDAYA